MNQFSNWALSESVTHTQIESFLKRKGWKIKKHKNSNIIVYETFFGPSSEPISIVIPATSSLIDYRRNINNNIVALSEIYQLNIDDIIYKLTHWDIDVLKIRFETKSVENSLLSLDDAANFILDYKNFIAYAAATEIDPRRFFSKLTGAGKSFVEDCNFGHTFVGSFGITIECPLNNERSWNSLNIPDIKPPKSISRRVTERIVRGYSLLNKAVHENDYGILVKNHATAFSGNMCDILLGVIDKANGREIEHEMIWATEIPSEIENSNQRSIFKLNEKSNGVLIAASEALHLVDEPEKDKTIIGRITGLKSEVPPQELSKYDRTIIILWEEDKKQPIRIHIKLQPDQYIQACDAHKYGKRFDLPPFIVPHSMLVFEA